MAAHFRIPPPERSQPARCAPNLVLTSVLLCAAAARPASGSSTRKRHANRRKPRPPSSKRNLLRQGSIAEANKKIQEQLALHPSSVVGYNLLGIAYSTEKDYSNALEAFQHALKLTPNSTKTHNNLGNLYIEQNNADLAEKEFRTVLRLDPADREGNYNLALLLMAKGLPAEAIPHFQRVRPANIETQFNLVRAYLQAGKTADGLAWPRNSQRRAKTTCTSTLLWESFWLPKNSIRAAHLNWRKPTHYSPKPLRFFTISGRRICERANSRKPNWS